MEFGSVFCKSDLLQIMTIGGIRFSSDLLTERTERSYVFTARSSDFLSDRLSTNKTEKNGEKMVNRWSKSGQKVVKRGLKVITK